MTPILLDLPENYHSLEHMKRWLDHHEILGSIVWFQGINKGFKLEFKDAEYATLFQLKWNYHGQ